MTSKRGLPIVFKFGLRSLLISVAIVAAYLAGWMSHRQWNQRNVDAVVSDAVGRMAETQPTIDGKKTLYLKDIESDLKKIREAARK